MNKPTITPKPAPLPAVLNILAQLAQTKPAEARQTAAAIRAINCGKI